MLRSFFFFIGQIILKKKRRNIEDVTGGVTTKPNLPPPDTPPTTPFFDERRRVFFFLSFYILSAAMKTYWFYYDVVMHIQFVCLPEILRSDKVEKQKIKPTTFFVAFLASSLVRRSDKMYWFFLKTGNIDRCDSGISLLSRQKQSSSLDIFTKHLYISTFWTW